jgi:hypothetical protein
MGVSGQLHAPAAFTPGDTAPGTHCVGGWLGLRADLDVMEERKISCPWRESNPDSSVVQPSRPIDWANPANRC